MKLKNIAKLLSANLITSDSNFLETDILEVCGADLMSDVLAFSKSGALLLTGLTNPQVIRTAEMADIKAIIFVRGKKPSLELIKMADSKELPLLSTTLTMFHACGHLYDTELANCS